MDILLVGLRDKLHFIERFYEAASAPFREAKRKIEAGEDPYTPPCFDLDTVTDFEPPFLSEWTEADESLNLIGQAGLSLVQGSLHDYLCWFLRLSQVELSAKGANWLEKYKNQFRETYGIDWDKGPVSFAELEEINLARNDIAHQGDPFAMTRRQGTDHRRRFPLGLFVHGVDRQMIAVSAHRWEGRIYVTSENLTESIRRVERFCEFLDRQRP